MRHKNTFLYCHVSRFISHFAKNDSEPHNKKRFKSLKLLELISEGWSIQLMSEVDKKGHNIHNSYTEINWMVKHPWLDENQWNG